MASSQDDCLDFTVNEQNCLAELCSIIATQGYFYLRATGQVGQAALGEGEYEQFSKKTICKLENLFECFPSINWGELYDQFHRSGRNR